MRETFESLYTKAQDLCVDPTSTSQNNLTDTLTFLKREINLANRSTHRYLNNYKTQSDSFTDTTEDGTQYYKYPPGVSAVSSVTITIGGTVYPVEIVSSEERWNKLNTVEIASFTVPQFIFPRQRDYGIFPIPRDAYTITFNAQYMPKDMSADDYSTGTVSLTNASATVTGSGTTFTSSMAGMWFRVNGDWYKILSYTSGTVITLERKFTGTTASGLSYLIGESPDLPEEAHEFLPYKAAASWYAGPRRDTTHAQKLLNYYYTGDYNNENRKTEYVEGGMIQVRQDYRKLGRGKSQLTKRYATTNYVYDERWTTTLSSS